MYSHGCGTKANVIDNCGRTTKPGSHPTALTIYLTCPWKVTFYVKKSLIFDSRLPKHLFSKAHYPKMKDGKGDEAQPAIETHREAVEIECWPNDIADVCNDVNSTLESYPSDSESDFPISTSTPIKPMTVVHCNLSDLSNLSNLNLADDQGVDAPQAEISNQSKRPRTHGQYQKRLSFANSSDSQNSSGCPEPRRSTRLSTNSSLHLHLEDTTLSSASGQSVSTALATVPVSINQSSQSFHSCQSSASFHSTQSSQQSFQSCQQSFQSAQSSRSSKSSEASRTSNIIPAFSPANAAQQNRNYLDNVVQALEWMVRFYNIRKF